MDVRRRGSTPTGGLERQVIVPHSEGRSSAAAVGWSGLAYAVRVGAQVLTLVLLSRILAPADFGIMAMAAVVIGLATVVRDLGAGPAIVREANLTASFVASQLVVAATFGVVLAVLIILIAPFASAVFGEPDLTPILSVLALGFVIGGLGVVPRPSSSAAWRFGRSLQPRSSPAPWRSWSRWARRGQDWARWRWRFRPSSRPP